MFRTTGRWKDRKIEFGEDEDVCICVCESTLSQTQLVFTPSKQASNTTTTKLLETFHQTYLSLFLSLSHAQTHHQTINITNSAVGGFFLYFCSAVVVIAVVLGVVGSRHQRYPHVLPDPRQCFTTRNDLMWVCAKGFVRFTTPGAAKG